MSLTSWLLCSIFLASLLFLLKVEGSPISISEEAQDDDIETEVGAGKRNGSDRGLIDILENFRLWQVERRKGEPSSSTSAPTPEPQGFEAFLPKIEIPKVDENTFGSIVMNINNAAQDIVKSFLGPPPTEPEPPMMSINGTNASSTIPPNTYFCFLC